MPIRNFSTLVNRLSISAPGCPYPIIEQYIRDAAIRACEQTLAWRVRQVAIDLVDGQFEYDYVVPAESEVHGVITATLNNVEIPYLSLEQLTGIMPEFPTGEEERRAKPRYVTQYNPDQFAVAPTPDAAETYTLRLTLALKPLRAAVGMDRTTMDELEDVILHGALQELLIIPGQVWTDRELAGYHARQFTYKVAERRARTNLGNGRASVAVEMRPLA